MDKQAFEPTGLVPRSIIRTVERFKQQLLPGTEALAIQEFRISRYQVLVSLRCLAILVCAPILVNLLVKTFVFSPIVEHLWNAHQNEIFINSYQEDRALLEMQNFSEKVFFESLLGEVPIGNDVQPNMSQESLYSSPQANDSLYGSLGCNAPLTGLTCCGVTGKGWPSNPYKNIVSQCPQVSIESTAMQKQFQHRATQLATVFNRESLQAIINLLGDCVTFLTVFMLSVWMRPQIVILKSFLTESIYSFSDTSKSFLLILCTDLLVGFHSPRGWEIAIESLLRHFGLPENQDFIFLFVAAFPVFLDTIFKYWIFRYLNKISPSTVATYHNMIE
jgi:hypothetical protein